MPVLKVEDYCSNNPVLCASWASLPDIIKEFIPKKPDREILW